MRPDGVSMARLPSSQRQEKHIPETSLLCLQMNNFPVDRLSCSYTVLWNQFKRLTKDFSAAERTAMFHDTGDACVPASPPLRNIRPLRGDFRRPISGGHRSAPSGAVSIYVFPGLTPWATFSRRFAAKQFIHTCRPPLQCPNPIIIARADWAGVGSAPPLADSSSHLQDGT